MLITDYHRMLYTEYFASKTLPASKPYRWQHAIEQLRRETEAITVLDYGCGPGVPLERFADFPVESYDPGVPTLVVLPHRADLVVCIHTLEHVEPECIDVILAHLRVLARHALFLVISCEPSTKLLPDGSPWHSLVRPWYWWAEQLHELGGDLQPIQGNEQPTAQEYGCVVYGEEEGTWS